MKGSLLFGGGGGPKHGLCSFCILARGFSNYHFGMRSVAAEIHRKKRSVVCGADPFLKVKKHWCPCTGTSGCFSVTALGSPARQGNVAQGQTSFVSLHKCPWLLLGHHQTHEPCKTTQYGRRSKSIGVLARVLLDASRSLHSGLLQDKAM